MGIKPEKAAKLPWQPFPEKEKKMKKLISENVTLQPLCHLAK